MSDSQENSTKKSPRLYILIAALIAGIIAITAAAVQLVPQFSSEAEMVSADDKICCTVSLRLYDGTSEETTVEKGTEYEAVNPPKVENRYFKYWKGTDGATLLPGEVITVYDDLEYTAEYGLSLDTSKHTAYIFPDENGFFRLEEYLTRGEAANIIATFIPEGTEITDSFLDVKKGSEYYESTAMLKSLKVVDGSRFYPDEYITRAELFSMLAFFYSEAEEYSFRDIKPGVYGYEAFCTAAEQGWISNPNCTRTYPNEFITRKDTVLLMNRVLERTPSAHTAQMTGGILDVATDDEFYNELAEAAITHDFLLEDGMEIWTYSEPVVSREPGFMMTGIRLYYVLEDGSLARDTEINGFKFDADGIYTSGDAELDEMVNAVLRETFNAEYTKEEWLKALYDYIVYDHFKYLKRTYYTVGDSSYMVEAAKIMFSEGKGNCYNFAAAFCALARALGYDAVVYSGYIGQKMEKHGWCEIKTETGAKICDTEIEWKYYYKYNKKLDKFMKSYDELKSEYYMRSTEQQAECEAEQKLAEEYIAALTESEIKS